MQASMCPCIVHRVSQRFLTYFLHAYTPDTDTAFFHIPSTPTPAWCDNIVPVSVLSYSLFFLSAFVHKIHMTLLIHLDFTQSGPKCSVPNDATFPTYVSAEQHVRSCVCCVDSNEHLPTCCSSHVKITRIGQFISILLTSFRPLVYAQQAGYVSGTGGFGVGV